MTCACITWLSCDLVHASHDSHVTCACITWLSCDLCMHHMTHVTCAFITWLSCDLVANIHHITHYTILTDTFVPGKLPRKRKAQYQRKFPPTAKRHRPNQAHPSSTHSTYNRNQTTNAHPTNKRPNTHPTAKRYSTTSTRPTAKRYSTTSTRPSPTVAKRLKRVQQKQPRTGRQGPRNSEQREPLVKFARRRGQRPKTAPHSKIKKRSAGQVFRKRAKAS